jgi:hypothetical protein
VGRGGRLHRVLAGALSFRMIRGIVLG